MRKPLLTALGFIFPLQQPQVAGNGQSWVLAVLREEEKGHTQGQTQSLSQLCWAPRAVTACPLLPQHSMAQTRARDKKIRSERSKSRGFLLPSTPSREGFRSVLSLWKRSGPAHGCQGRALLAQHRLCLFMEISQLPQATTQHQKTSRSPRDSLTNKANDKAGDKHFPGCLH